MVELKQFIDEYSRELSEGTAAYFIGAGISKDSKLPNWAGLVRPMAKRLGIENLEGKDLTQIAQYIINENTGNKGPMMNLIVKRVANGFTHNAYHSAISKTNLKTIWTTNFDTLIETAFPTGLVDVKWGDGNMARSIPDTEVEVIKMHGCVRNSNLNDIVIASSDYDDYFIKNPAIVHRLKMDLVSKSFLFLGYRYQDPNIKNIIIEARRLVHNTTRQHYIVLKNQKDVEFQLWAKDLKRVGIHPVLIDKYEELQTILLALSKKSRGRSIFVTGSHAVNASPVARELGSLLSTIDDVILHDGQSTGIMRETATAFLQKAFESKIEMSKRWKIFPNPYAVNPKFANDISLLPMLKEWRRQLLKATQIVIVFNGGMGTEAEIDVAIDMGCFIIPFPQSRSDKDLAFKILNNPKIRDPLLQAAPDYYRKALRGNVSPKEVINCVKFILER